MIIVCGESGAGKSSFAKSILKGKKRSLYILLDKDQNAIHGLRESSIDLCVIERCLIIDIKSKLLERGGLLDNQLDYVVIDSINQIKDRIPYSEIISCIDRIGKDLNIKIAVVFNLPKKADGLRSFASSIEGHKVVYVDPVTGPALGLPQLL